MARGRLIAFEGIDGCGKSTQARRVAAARNAVLTHEPGDSELGRRLRQLLLDPAGPPIAPRAEALLMSADRAQHVVEVIEPALAAGRDVVTDRYVGSTLAYQGGGQQLDDDDLALVASWGASGLIADCTVLLDCDVEVARSRLGNERLDRLESLGSGFQRRVRQSFLDQAAAAPARWVVIDASGTLEEVQTAVDRALADRLG